MNLIKFLQSYKNPDKALEELENQYSIVMKKYDDRVIFNYSQSDSPKNHPITNECRGLILSYPDWKIISRPFDRFFNYGETDQSQQINILNSLTFEKLDGSFIQIYHDNNQWNIATRGTAFAENSTPYDETTFYELVNKAINFNSLQKALDKGFTYLCEITSPYNRVVKPYNGIKLHLLGVRNKITGEFFNPYDFEFLKEHNLYLPKMYNFNSIDEIQKNLNELETLDEGYVCWEPDTDIRVKIKSPTYLAIHYLRNNGAVNPKSITYLVFENEYDEYLSYFECDKPLFDPYIKAYDNMIKDINEKWNKFKDIENQKEFALNVKDLSINSVLFKMRSGFTLSEIFDNMNIKRKVDLLEYYKEK